MDYRSASFIYDIQSGKVSTSRYDITKFNSFEDALFDAFKKSSSKYNLKTFEENKEFITGALGRLAQTDQAKNLILSNIAYGTNIDILDFYRKNASTGKTLKRTGLIAYATDVQGKDFDAVRRNISTIANNKAAEICYSSLEYLNGPIGVTAEIKEKYHSAHDVWSKLERDENGKIVERIIPTEVRDENGNLLKRYLGKDRIELETKDIINFQEDKLSQLLENDHVKQMTKVTGKSVEELTDKDWFHLHDEIIGTEAEIKSLWVKKYYYNEHQEEIYQLMKEHDISSIEVFDVGKKRQNVRNIKSKEYTIDEVKEHLSKNKLKTKKIKNAPNKLTNNNNLTNSDKLTESANKLGSKKELAIAGAIIAGAVIGGSMLLSKNKKEKKQHKTGLYESFDYNNYDKDKDTKNAKKVSSFSRGHSTVNFK